MGNTYLAVKALFDGLGVDYIIPEFNSKESLEVGSLYSPEEICLPFKLMIGNYIKSIERGADTIIITGSCGPCRYGEYCELQINILKKLGHKLDFIVLDNPADIGKEEFMRRIGMVSSHSEKTRREQLKSVYYGIKVLRLIDEIEAKAHHLAGYEKNKGECKRILNRCRAEAESCNDPREMIDTLKRYKKSLSNIETCPDRNPVKVAIVGEIFTVIEPFSNLYIEDKLMDYGISTKRRMNQSWWLNNLIFTPLKINSIDVRLAARKYLPHPIGGHARQCIGETVLAHEEGYDGAIQIFPMGCMPEIVSKSILPTISKDKDFPIMTLVVDEMTGEAGYVTRIEAFLDLLERRKK